MTPMSPIDPEERYRQLEHTVERLGISIRYEHLSCTTDIGARSGLCKVRGNYLYIMDINTTIHERIKALSECLARLDLDEIYIMPAIREMIEGD